MKKKIFSTLLMGVFILTTMSVFTSCKDYDDDINNLQTQIDANKKAIQDIQNLIANGGVITSVDNITNGVKVTLSNGKTFEIYNGEKGDKGDQGTSWQIGTDGYWYKDGVKTDYYALGTKGADGLTPTIGTNGNWWIGTTDTGVSAQGPAGANGLTPTIGSNGNWWIGTTDTGVPATGNNGGNGADGIYYVPNPATGCFDIYKNGEKIQETTISFLGTGTITAVLDPAREILTLYGVQGTNGPVTISLNGKLSSLVFKPFLYLDGIESIEYPWIGDTILRKTQLYRYDDLSHHQDNAGNGQNISGLTDYVPNTLARNYNNLPKPGSVQFPRDEWIYGPAWEVDYHLNPATSRVSYADGVQYSVLEPEVIYYNTRAAASALNITSPEEFFTLPFNAWHRAASYGNFTGLGNTTTFGNYDGILKAGLQIEHPDRLAPWPTDDTINPNEYDNTVVYGPSATPPATDAYAKYGSWYGYTRYKYNAENRDNTVAIQLPDGDDMITSDYALIVPTRIQLEGLVWAKAPMYLEPCDYDANGNRINQFGPNAYNPGSRIGDEEGWASDGINDCATQRIHVWDSPEEAINDPNGAALEVGALDPAGIDLKEYLGIHYLQENLKYKEKDEPFLIRTFRYGEEKAFGLHYEFEFIDYYDSSNDTYDSRYATFEDTQLNAAKDGLVSTSGVVIAKNVDADKNTVATQSRTSVDREPLVRVLVKNEAGDVLLDGYILIHITYTPENHNIDLLPAVSLEFDLCNGVSSFDNGRQWTWAQFSNLILTQGMNNMERHTFDGYYWADCLVDPGFTVPAGDEEYVTKEARWLGNANTGSPNAPDANNWYQLKMWNFGTDIYGNGGLPPTLGGAPFENAVKKRANDSCGGGAFFEPDETGTEEGLGVVSYYPNGDGVTNHTIRWDLSEAEVEYLTHDTNTPVTVTRWIRFVAKDDKRYRDVNNYSAPYPYVWVRLQLTLTRKQNTDKFGAKIDNYWYNWNTGADNGWSAIVFDIQAPRDGFYANPFNRAIRTTLLGNMENTGNPHKYYFAPKPESLTFYTLTREADNNTVILDNNVNVSPTAYPSFYTDAERRFGPNPTNVYQSNVNNLKAVKSVLEVDGINPTVFQTIKAAGNGIAQEEWVITPQGPDQTDFDKLYCKYIITPPYCHTDIHNWVEANLETTLKGCAIDYTKGAFNNVKLYAYQNKVNGSTIPTGSRVYVHIATLNPATGAISLEKNDVTRLVLNAYGYEANHANIYKELRSWVGVVGSNGCEVAKFVKPEQTDDNLNTFLVSWQRPINTQADPIEVRLDANTNENFIYLIDYLKLYDWRGDKPNQGYMYDNHYWFWSYYMMKSISIDMRPDRVWSNMHYAGTNFKKLSDITRLADLVAWFSGGAQRKDLVVYSFNLSTYNAAAQETAIENFMGNPFQPITTTNRPNKEKMGTMYYQNNGDNLTEFDVIVPITLEYEWGWLSRLTQFHIDRTHGN